MTDSVGPTALSQGITPTMRNGNEVTVFTYFTTRLLFDELYEMFRKAPGNSAVNTLLGGQQICYDITDDSVLTQYCSFDSDRLIDGWYVLRGLSVPQDNLASYYPAQMTLFFLGTTGSGLLIRGVELSQLDDVTNDWSI